MADDMVLRALFKRLQKQVEHIAIQISGVLVTITGQSLQTFGTYAEFLASDGVFAFAWLNNRETGDGTASLWINANSYTPATNTSDIQAVVGGIKFVRIYVRENL